MTKRNHHTIVLDTGALCYEKPATQHGEVIILRSLIAVPRLFYGTTTKPPSNPNPTEYARPRKNPGAAIGRVPTLCPPLHAAPLCLWPCVPHSGAPKNISHSHRSQRGSDNAATGGPQRAGPARTALACIASPVGPSTCRGI